MTDVFTVTAVVYIVLIVAFFGAMATAAIMMGREGIAQAQAEEWRARARIAEMSPLPQKEEK